MPNFEVKFNFPAAQALDAMTSSLSGPTGDLMGGVRKAAGKVRDQTKKNITAKRRIDNGRMRQSVSYKILPGSGATHATAEVGIYVRYAEWQEKGTPKSAPGVGFIYPRTVKMLRFKPKGSSKFVFAKRVRGVKPGNFLKDAVATLSADDFKGPAAL